MTPEELAQVVAAVKASLIEGDPSLKQDMGPERQADPKMVDTLSVENLKNTGGDSPPSHLACFKLEQSNPSSASKKWPTIMQERPRGVLMSWLSGLLSRILLNQLLSGRLGRLAISQCSLPDWRRVSRPQPSGWRICWLEF